MNAERGHVHHDDDSDSRYEALQKCTAKNNVDKAQPKEAKNK
jgi:hypothetical protein